MGVVKAFYCDPRQKFIMPERSHEYLVKMVADRKIKAVYT